MKEGKNKINRDLETASSDEEGRVYGIYHIKIVEASNELDSELNRLIKQRRCGQMAHKKIT